MSFLSDMERALKLGLTAEEFKTMWEADIKRSQLEAEKDVLRLRKEIQPSQVTQVSSDNGHDKLMKYIQAKFQDLLEELTWIKKDLMETMLRQSAMTNDKIEASMKEIKTCIQNIRGTERAHDNSSIALGNYDIRPFGITSNIGVQNSSTVTQEHDQNMVFNDINWKSPDKVEQQIQEEPLLSDWSDQADVGAYDLHIEQTHLVEKLSNGIDQDWSQEDGSEWQTVGPKVKAKSSSSAQALGPYSEQISRMLSRKDIYRSMPNILPTKFINFDTELGQGSLTINNVKEFFSARTSVETELLYTQPLNCCYTMQFQFNRNGHFEVNVKLHLIDKVNQGPIKIACVGEIYNPQSRRFTKLWRLDHDVVDFHEEIQLKADVCLDTLRGKYTPVKYTTLAKRHFEQHDRFDLKWIITAS
ncbi:hypothetical protein Bpfe_017251 [Biomphalaria pfeifferi]|uniref:Uncharacterized protein n=1 Tax=Biomphalaria pfeifferi TaxID=112525 RepID=A0AAD8BEZ4_BIOPF|nr:hypothetical protein Bpfe_017251 [Biomphalaria pfeifferi]